MYEARSAEYIEIYESIVMDFFLWLKIHRICADFPRFDIENLNFIVSRAKPWNISDMHFHGKHVGLYCARPYQYNITVDS